MPAGFGIGGWGQKSGCQTKTARQAWSSTVGAAVAPVVAGSGVAVALGAAAKVGSGVVGTGAVVGAAVEGMGAVVAGTGAGVATSTYISTCDAWVGSYKFHEDAWGSKRGRGEQDAITRLCFCCGLAQDQNHKC